MGPVWESAAVANGSAGMGGAGGMREDEQEIFKALSLGERLSDTLMKEELRKGKERKD